MRGLGRPGTKGNVGPHRGTGGAVAGSLVVHIVAGALIVLPAGVRRAMPPVYRVDLVAAPKSTQQKRRAPEVVKRSAEQTVPTRRKRRTSVAETPPPPKRDPNREQEPAARTNPDTLVADAEPSTGSDPATVNTSGVDFPYPAYLQNIVVQVYRRWSRPKGNRSLKAEVLFFIHRDGSVTNFQFVQRSGSFAFDIEAQGAIEAAANSGVFGPLPDGYPSDVLPVSFFFDPKSAR
ncbi:MAG: TonB C-terminal domain-containing protein [Gemmatimonadales bacterium]